MAISIKSLNGLAAIKKIGVPQELYDWLAAQPVKVALNAKEFHFTVPLKDGGDPAEMSVPVELNALQKLAMGTLDATQKNALREALVSTIKSIRDQFGEMLAEIDPAAEQLAAHAAQATPLASVLNKLPPIKPPLSPETKETLQEATGGVTIKTKQSAWLPFDEKKMKTAELVKLRDATMMYQPVFGTSAGSRYYMVAASKDVRVAARLSGSTLSIRIEGPNWKKYASQVKAVGIETHGSKDYASVHLAVGNDLQMASKTLGAVLLGLGVPLETPIPELKKIAI